MEDLYETKILVFREDETDGNPVKFEIPPGAEMDEIKEKLFKLVYPNCGDAPLECKLVTLGHADIDDMSVLIAVPDGKIVVAPGPNFVDKSGRKKAREKEEKEKEKQREKEEKERKKEEEKKEKEKEKEEKKTNSLTRKSSLFESFRKKTSPVASSLSNESGEDETRSDFAKVYHKGYLNKKNEILAGGKIPNRNWLTYWVVLRSYHLLFYKERKHYTAQKPPVGGLDIKGCVVELVFEYKKRDHVFRLKTSRGASYLLEAESLEEMTAWLTYIEQASKFVPGENSGENVAAAPAEATSTEPKEEETFEDESHQEEDAAPAPRSNLSPEEENNLAEEEKRIEGN